MLRLSVMNNNACDGPCYLAT
uniref:Uncharacterized protein n=1 Tax=Arundo donax TaxID=35708 RepID=A0A0A9AE12_ARUDO